MTISKYYIVPFFLNERLYKILKELHYYILKIKKLLNVEGQKKQKIKST